MKYLKLFEEMKIGGEKEFPFDGHDLSPRERKIITDLVPGFYLNKFTIKVDDHYYYTKFSGFHTYYNVFDNFNDLKDYVLFKCYINMNKPEEFLELLKTSKLDPSFDTNDALRWAYRNRYIEIFKHLLSDHRVDPTFNDNFLIKYANDNLDREMVRFLLNDERVRSKLPEWHINRYTKRFESSTDIKLFEEITIQKNEFPLSGGHDISPREYKILTDMVGEYLTNFEIKVDDFRYYTNSDGFYNSFDDFIELKDYLLSRYYMSYHNTEEYLKLLKTSKIDPSLDDNWPIWWASSNGYTEIVKHLLSDSRVDPSFEDNCQIKLAYKNGHTKVTKLLLNDERVRSKLTQKEINKYKGYIGKLLSYFID